MDTRNVFTCGNCGNLVRCGKYDDHVWCTRCGYKVYNPGQASPYDLSKLPRIRKKRKRHPSPYDLSDR